MQLVHVQAQVPMQLVLVPQVLLQALPGRLELGSPQLLQEELADLAFSGWLGELSIQLPHVGGGVAAAGSHHFERPALVASRPPP